MLYSITSVVTSFYVDGAVLDVVSDGDGDAIVLLHGFPLRREIWNAQLPRSRKRTARSVRICAAWDDRVRPADRT